MSDKNVVERTDLAVAECVEPLRTHPMVKVAGTLSEIADQPQMFTLCTAVLFTGLIGRDERLARTGARMLAAEALATAMKSVIKHRIDRTRPAAISDEQDYVMCPGDTHTSEFSSFPSGHTAGAVAVASSFAKGYPQAGKIAGVSAAAIALIQIPRSKHFLSDLLAGALIGRIAASAVAAAERLTFPPSEAKRTHV